MYRVTRLRRGRKNNILQEDLERRRAINNIKKNIKIEKCPFCRNRMDNITEISVHFLEGVVQNFIDHLKLNKKDSKKLEKEKYIFLKKIIRKVNG